MQLQGGENERYYNVLRLFAYGTYQDYKRRIWLNQHVCVCLRVTRTFRDTRGVPNT